MLLPDVLAPGRSLGWGQAVLSGGAVCPLKVLLTLWAPTSGAGRLLLAVHLGSCSGPRRIFLRCLV